ncbi:MAG: UDP-N-acetylmuramate--L-alanine ligase [Acidobacteriota bacterium]|nr:UDP-N-acetylmuramate--L-alanine ligase [Acidobacteriota bacterium]
MFKKYQHIHFVGIGGIGMSGIAEVLLNLGYRVSGSDARKSAITERLEKLGASVFEGHATTNVEGAQVVVTSTAVRSDNPEVVEAVRKQVPVIPRAEMLAELMRLKYGIAIAGSHGKTTTTSMVATVLDRAGVDPTIVVGGRVNTLGSNAKLGRGDFMVVEADESDKSFLKLSPTIAVVTNIDLEHLDFYSGIEEIRDHFVQFVNKVPFYGSVIICLDDTNIQMIIPQITRRVITYGMRAHAEIAASNIEISRENFGSSFTVRRRGEELGRIKLNVPGEHNVCNALAAVAVALDLEVDFAKIAEGLEAFTGAGRRFEIKGLVPDSTPDGGKGILVVDDYGHHPTEIRATLAAAKTSGRRLVVLFQPHRYTRTAALKEDFARSFYDADVVLLSDIYAASEEPIPGVTSQALVEEIEKFGHRNVRFIGAVENGGQALLEIAQPGDLVLTLGAGSVWRAGEEFLAAKQSADHS